MFRSAATSWPIACSVLPHGVVIIGIGTGLRFAGTRGAVAK
jgi:hypothetical protein